MLLSHIASNGEKHRQVTTLFGLFFCLVCLVFTSIYGTGEHDWLFGKATVILALGVFAAEALEQRAWHLSETKKHVLIVFASFAIVVPFYVHEQNWLQWGNPKYPFADLLEDLLFAFAGGFSALIGSTKAVNRK